MENNSFWELINEHRIEIPVIQRDYAQGRSTKKSTAIRKSFVESIFNALRGDKNEHIHLNFIYGKIKGLKDQKRIEENKKAIEMMLSAVEGYSKGLDLDVTCVVTEKSDTEGVINATSFVPLDGQQRLTTLYLVHWYLLKRQGIDDNKLKKLKNFTYLIRPSTKQFCKELIEKNIDMTVAHLSDAIADSSWFFQYWKKDPSVTGMLTVLDEIHSVCKELNDDTISQMVETLTDSQSVKPISFELLNLDDFELTDKLYVKMNSRGKALTPFENFKSWLMEHISNEDMKILVKDWQKKLDTTWADLFWEHKDDQNMLIDEEMLRYFRNMMQLWYIYKNPLIAPRSADDIEKELFAKKRENANRLASEKGEDREYVFMDFSEYKQLEVLTEDSINEMFHCLDLLAKNHDEITGPIFKGFVTGEMTLRDKVLFYALYQYLNNTDEKHDLKKFERIYRNLTTNYLFDSVTDVKTILTGVKNDCGKFSDIYGNVALGDIKFTGFRGSQAREERLKASLLCHGKFEWEEPIITAEKHRFFNGQIGFVFAFCGLFDDNKSPDIESWNKDEEQVLFNAFTATSKIVRELFDENGFIDDGTHLFERALLTFGDYLYRSGSKKVFWKNNKERDNSWHRVLREYGNSDYDMVWNTFKELIEYLITSNSPVVETLKSTIENYQENDPFSWRYSFIKYYTTIEQCGKNRHFIDWERQKYLLSGATRRSEYTELESYRLFKSELENKLTNFPGFANTGYYSCMNKEGHPCAYIDGYQIDDMNIAVDVRFYGNDKDCWEFKVFARKKDIRKVSENIQKYFEDSGYLLFLDEDPKSYYTKCFPSTMLHSEIADELKALANTLYTLENSY